MYSKDKICNVFKELLYKHLKYCSLMNPRDDYLTMQAVRVLFLGYMRHMLETIV